jgi:hypothetical protein
MAIAALRRPVAPRPEAARELPCELRVVEIPETDRLVDQRP